MKVKMNNKMNEAYKKTIDVKLECNMCKFDIYDMCDALLLFKGKEVDEDACIRGINKRGKMMYEVSNNEIYINKYIEGETDLIKVISCGKSIIKNLQNRIRTKYEKKVCYILSVDREYNGIVTFHEVLDEELWVDDNLDNYDNYIAIFVD